VEVVERHNNNNNNNSMSCTHAQLEHALAGFSAQLRGFAQRASDSVVVLRRTVDYRPQGSGEKWQQMKDSGCALSARWSV
jgi:hypothetical protein